MKTKYLLLVYLFAIQSIYAQTTYYVDADATDGGNGTSVGTAWNEISDVNAATFNPGDQILFNSGDTFYGKLRIPSSGIDGNPIVFGKYGGTDKPIINGRNYIACIDGSGRSYITVQDLELINDSNEDTGIVDTCTNGGCTNGAEQKRYGFYANSASGLRNGIVLDNLEIHKIYPSTPDGNNEYNGHAIQFTGWGSASNNYFDGITIQNCELYDTGILGVSVNKWGNPPVDNIHKNITINNNYIHHTGGSGIVFFEVNGYLIENNKITYTGDYSLDTRQRGRGSGFWNVRTSNGLLQYNEFSNANGPKDSCGAHIDIGNDNVIIQYNLSMNNAGGFAEFMGDNTNCIYRYNVSINDGWRVKYDATQNPAPTAVTHPEMFTPKGESNGQVGAAVWFSNYFGPGESDVPSIGNAVYNNTFYIGTYMYDNGDVTTAIPINAYFEFETGSDDNLIQNNIFHVESGSSISYFEEAGAIVEKGDIDFNIYSNVGPVDGSMPKWISGVGTIMVNTDESYLTGGFTGDDENFNTDPKLENPGGTSSEDYKIKPSSPAIDNGKDITDNGGIDYWLNSLVGVPSGDTDIGANERKCDDDTTFSGTWSSGLPTALDQVIINSDYTLPTDGSFDACQITINQGATLTIPADEYVNVNGNITINGTLIVNNDGSVVQIDDSAIVNNKGSITVEKETDVLNDRDFTILGSPMTNETRENAYVDAFIVRNHDTDLFTPNPEVENDFPLAENFADDNGDNWNDYLSGNLNPGEGYLVKPLELGDTDAIYSTSYTQGTLTNGVVNVAVKFGDNQNDSPNILSNPYASAVDAYEFIDNNPLVDAIYYWEHIEDPSVSYPGYNVANYQMGDISMYNLSGGIAATNNGGGIQNSNQFIPSGQGFAIKANAAGTVTFNNAMRVTENNGGYRNIDENIERLSITLKNSNYGLKSGTLIAFSENATNGYDVKYDAKRLATPVSIFSINHDMELGIQGRASFTETQTIPIGFSTQIEESQEYAIGINSLEGDLINQATVYLQDNELHTLTNLSDADYIFTAEAGTQKDRFVIVFEPIELGTQDIAQALSMYPNPVNERVTINSYAGYLQSVTVYDLQGREVQQWISEQMVTSAQIDVSHLQSSVYMVSISTDQGTTTKRLLKK